MPDNRENINPRYLKYRSTAEVQAILEGVEHIDDTPTPGSDYPVSSGGVAAALEAAGIRISIAEEAAVRGIVTSYTPMNEEEPEGE